MKGLTLAAIAMTFAASIFAQGTVYFNNRTSGGITHVWAGWWVQYQGNGPNDVPPGPTSYYGCNLIGTTGGYLDAATTFAQLLGAPGAGAPQSSLLPGSPTTTFRTGAASGNVAPTTATFGNIPPDAAVATFQMVAWDNRTGLYPTWPQALVAWKAGLLTGAGMSTPFTLNSIGGEFNTPPNLSPGLTSFNIILSPEPTTAALAALGSAMWLIIRRRK